MSYIKRKINNHQYELSTSLGDQIKIRITDTKRNVVIADYTKPMSEEIITMLESEIAHRSLIDIICLNAQDQYKVNNRFRSNFSEGSETHDLAHMFSAN